MSSARRSRVGNNVARVNAEKWDIAGNGSSSESTGPEKRGSGNWRMRGKIDHVGYIMGLPRARASSNGGQSEYLDELTPIGVRTVRIQYLARGPWCEPVERRRKMGELIMQIGHKVT